MADWMVPVLIVLTIAAVCGFIYWRKHRTAPKGWVIGPVVRGKNYSVGLPLRPTPTVTGWKFKLPVGAQVDAVDIDTGPLSLNSVIRFQLKTINPKGGTIRPFDYPTEEPVLGLYFQRRGDDWSADGKMEHYRWYSIPTVNLMQGGGLQIVLAPDAWMSIMGAPGTDKLAEFMAALANACRIGLTFGAPGGRSHGVVADQEVEFELMSWSTGK